MLEVPQFYSINSTPFQDLLHVYFYTFFKIKCLYAGEAVIVSGTHKVSDGAAVTCKEAK